MKILIEWKTKNDRAQSRKNAKKIAILKEPFFVCQNNLRFEFGIDKYPR
jgi:hypothetical protein